MDYRGVESIVDSLGGIEVVVPFHMVYKDPPTATPPPLYINIPEGEANIRRETIFEFPKI